MSEKASTAIPEDGAGVPVSTYPQPTHGWTCYHCGETFTTRGSAEDHFGKFEGTTPGCILRVQLGDERGWLMELRKEQESSEQQLQRALEAERDIERLECRVEALTTDFKQFKPFRDCDSANEAFFVYDSMEGRALAAEERLAKLLEDRGGGGCTREGEGGDCEHLLGLPGYSIPNSHDGPDDTVDVYGKPNGWCWSCWKSRQVAALTQEVATLKAENQQWRTWGIVEVAVRNPSVAGYMEHWEGRATKAEATLAEDQYIAEANISLHERLNEAEAALATLRSENERLWISVEERLPEDGVEVLACLGALVNVDDGFASRYVAWLDHDTQPPQWIIAGNVTNGITHWQPLPTPPAHGPTSTEEKADGSQA